MAFRLNQEEQITVLQYIFISLIQAELSEEFRIHAVLQEHLVSQ